MMRPPHTDDLLEGVGARVAAGQPGELGPFTLDSRSVSPGGTFLAIRGPRFDGHAFVDAAIRAGATTAIVDEEGWATRPPERSRSARVVVVPDTVAALTALARAHRQRFDGVVVGVTGSSGKTTTKDYLGAALSVQGPTLTTAGNLNNHLGVPLTLLRLTDAHRYAVVEMGMSAAGEIADLAALAQPQVGVITSIGPAHLAGLGTVERVAAAKGELFASLPPDGLAVAPGNLDYAWIATRGLVSAVRFVGVHDLPLSRVRLLARGARGAVRFGERTVPLRVQGGGRHHLVNAVLALAVGEWLGIDPAAAAAAIAEVPPGRWRGETARLADGGWLHNDAYNANPQSMSAALEAFSGRHPDGLLVLGDMRELGGFSDRAHVDLGRAVAALRGNPTLLAVGESSESVVAAAVDAGLAAARAHAVPHVQAAADALPRLRAPGQSVLLKGSRGIGLEVLVDVLGRQGEDR